MGGEMGRQTVIRNEYEADAKPTGDSPGVCCGGFLMNQIKIFYRSQYHCQMNLILQNCCKNEDQELSLSSGIVSHLTADAKGNSTLMDSCLFY